MRLSPSLLLVAQLLLVGAFILPSASGFIHNASKFDGNNIHRMASSRRRNEFARPQPNVIGTSSGGGLGARHRGAGTSMAALPGSAWPAVQSTLLNAPYPKSLASLAAVASAVVVPLTLYRQAYSFSVGYGFSVAAMSIALLSAFSVHFFDFRSPAAVLASLGVVYGLRLGAFLLVREFTVPTKRAQLKQFDKSNWLKRIPFAMFVSGFYAMLTSPVLSALRGPEPAGALWKVVQWAGVGVAATGLMVESIADHHKYVAKMMQDASESFAGPTGGLYALCRHPNYLGEIMFWLGLYVGGLPTFGRAITTWVAATLGLYGNVSIMTKATERLDQKQAENYDGEAAYESWRDDTKAALVPFVEG